MYCERSVCWNKGTILSFATNNQGNITTYILPTECSAHMACSIRTVRGTEELSQCGRSWCSHRGGGWKSTHISAKHVASM
jgi:hypothetical protein